MKKKSRQAEYHQPDGVEHEPFPVDGFDNIFIKLDEEAAPPFSQRVEEAAAAIAQWSGLHKGLLFLLALLLVGLTAYILWLESYQTDMSTPVAVTTEVVSAEEPHSRDGLHPDFVASQAEPVAMERQSEDVMENIDKASMETAPVVATDLNAVQLEEDEFGLRLPVEKAVPASLVVADTVAAANVPTAVDTQTPVSNTGATQMKGVDWLYQQAASGFSLQLISASEEHNIDKLLAAHEDLVSGFARYTHYTKSGKPRYVLLYGSYASRADALAAINALPPTLARLNPWLRRFKDIHSQLNNRL